MHTSMQYAVYAVCRWLEIGRRWRAGPATLSPPPHQQPLEKPLYSIHHPNVLCRKAPLYSSHQPNVLWEQQESQNRGGCTNALLAGTYLRKATHWESSAPSNSPDNAAIFFAPPSFTPNVYNWFHQIFLQPAPLMLLCRVNARRIKGCQVFPTHMDILWCIPTV